MKASVFTPTSGRGRRVHRFAPKSRHGCVTCKGRRVKCDERKPNCTRCSVFGVQCGGYDEANGPKIPNTARSSADSNKRHRLEASSTNNTMLDPLSGTILEPKFLPGPLYGTYEERRALVVYLSTVAVSISDFSSPKFWKVLIPQASWAHPAIKHALIALTWRQTYLRSVTAESTRPDDLSMWHYNRSIRCLRLDAPTVEVTLLACFLLFTYENHDGSFAVARQHIKGGLKIIKEWQSRQRSTLNDSIMSQEIIPRFKEGVAFLQACLSGQPFPPATSAPHQSAPYTKVQQTNEAVTSPLSTAAVPDNGSFSSLEEACVALSECLRQSSLAHVDRNSTLSPLLLRWKRTLDWSGRLKNCDSSLLRMLNVHYYTCRAIGTALQSGPEDADTSYDAYLNDFAFIVNEMQILISKTHVRSSETLRMGLGFIPPLYLVAMRCCDLNIRTRAINMLYTLQRKEGRWTNSCAAKISEACLVWEGEKLGSSNIPQTDVDIPKAERRRKLGRIRVEISSDASGRRTAWLTPKNAMKPMAVALTQEEIDTIDWPILDVLNAYGYQDLLSR